MRVISHYQVAMPFMLPCDDAPHGLLSDKLQNKVSGQAGIVVAEAATQYCGQYRDGQWLLTFTKLKLAI